MKGSTDECYLKLAIVWHLFVINVILFNPVIESNSTDLVRVKLLRDLVKLSVHVIKHSHYLHKPINLGYMSINTINNFTSDSGPVQIQTLNNDKQFNNSVSE